MSSPKRSRAAQKHSVEALTNPLKVRPLPEKSVLEESQQKVGTLTKEPSKRIIN